MPRAPSLALRGSPYNPIVVDENGMVVSRLGGLCARSFSRPFQMTPLFLRTSHSSPWLSSSYTLRCQIVSLYLSFDRSLSSVGRLLRIYGTSPSESGRLFSGSHPESPSPPVPDALAATAVTRTTTSIRSARHEVTHVMGSTVSVSSSSTSSTSSFRDIRDRRRPLRNLAGAPTLRLRIRTREEVARRRAGYRAPRDFPLTEDELYTGPERPPAESNSELHECGICFNIQSHPVS